MGVKLRIDPKFKNLVNAFSAEHLNQYLTAVGDLELSKTRQRFRNQVDPDFNPWKITIRKILDPSAKILRKSGNLFNSTARQVAGKSVYIGTNLSYAVFHQDGTDKIPQRRIFGINNQTQKSIEQAFNTIMGKILK